MFLVFRKYFKTFKTKKKKKKKTKKKTGLNGYMYDFFVYYNIIDNSNMIDIHKYLMKKRDMK